MHSLHGSRDVASLLYRLTFLMLSLGTRGACPGDLIRDLIRNKTETSLFCVALSTGEANGNSLCQIGPTCMLN